MSRTITAMFNDRSEAEAAAAQLRTQIGTEPQIIDQSTGGSSSTAPSKGSSGGFWSDLKDIFIGDEDRATYEEGVRRGHFLLCANVPEEQADRACGLIEAAGAIDVDEQEQQWRSEGWAGAQGIRERSTQPQQTAGTQRGNIVEEERIPIVEEQLRVGKREEQRGGARVRSYVAEKPVSEQVNLREEHVNVERRPVNQQVSPDQLDRGLLREREVEMRETAEKPVVAKEAHVKEEVVVQKTANQRTEKVGGTVRRTDVEVDKAPTDKDKGAFGFEQDRETSSDSFDPDWKGRR